MTFGPSCRPGGLVVEVVAGTSPYSVRLATTRKPSGEDSAVLAPGQKVVLRTADVAYGETIDGRLEYAAQDGTGVTFVDELEEYSFTRPSKEDCDAIADPPATSTPPSPSSTAAAPTTSSSGAATPTSAAPTTGTPSTSPNATTGAAPTAGAGSSAPRAVTAGDVVTLQATGFLPGEAVVARLQGSDEVIASATAGPDGTVRADVRIPERTGPGAATVRLTGSRSEVVADVPLQVAAVERPVATDDADEVVPLAVAAVALVAAVASLISVAGRRRTGRRPIGSV